MLTVEPRRLLDKLDGTCLRGLERAAAKCVELRHYEVSVEHLVVALLDEPNSDMSVLFAHYGVDTATAVEGLRRYLGELRAGNAGKPVFGSLLLEWIQDAWLLGSVELGLDSVRSGCLLARLVVSPSRYLPQSWPSLEQIPRDELRTSLLTLTAASAEAAETSLRRDPRDVSAGASGGPLERFTTDLTERARQGELDPVLGREAEVRQVIEILVRRRKNNPLIVGEAGVGKTALVEGLAMRVAEGTVPEALKSVRVLSLDLGALQAGAGVRGEFESRLKGVIDSVKASPTPIVLFIDEAHTLIGAGGAQGGSDAANLLKPALARGELRTVAATTYAEFKKYFEKDAALERRFQPVRVEEPSLEVATDMIRGLAPRFEVAHGVRITDSAIRAAVGLSARYISGRQLPDKAVDLLDTSAAYVNLIRVAPPPELEDIRARLVALDRELEALARDEQAGLTVDEERRQAARAQRAERECEAHALEEELARQRAVLAEVDALRKPPESAASREGPSPNGAPQEGGTALREALERLASIPVDKRLVSADVDETVVASIVADWTGIPVGKMVKNDVQSVLTLHERLRERVKGQDGALEVIAKELQSARSGLKAPTCPLGVFLLVGPSGVGKTETALGLADLVFGGERFVVTVNMSEFQERHTTSRLIGSPPGYVGYGEGGVLTEAVRHRRYSVVLLDEVEKADRDVMNLFYQVFDKGMLADGEGRVVDFKNTVIVMTSNLASDLIMQACDDRTPTLDELVERVRPVLSAHFKPALLARMTVVPFVPIGRETLREIVLQKLAGVKERARSAHGTVLTIDDAVVEAIVARCVDAESGARNAEHILRAQVLPVLSGEILQALAADRSLATLRLGINTETGAFLCVREGE